MRAIANTVRIAAASLGLAIGAAEAQPADDPAAEALRLYHVEVIVFANSEGSGNEEWFAHELAKSRRAALAAEARPMPRVVASPDATSDGEDAIVLDSLSLDELVFAPPEEAPDDPNALLEDVLPGAPPEVALDTPTPSAADDGPVAEQDTAVPADELDVGVRYRTAGGTRTFRFRLLEDEELVLGNAYGHIDRLSAYVPLVHGGWVQEGLPEDEALPFDLVYLGATNPRGTIRLHLSRFLHVTLDLDYIRPGATAGGRTQRFALGEVSTTPRYPLETQRRLRSGELHYIDHPMFGVLVLVTPAPEPPEAETGDGRPQTPAA